MRSWRYIQARSSVQVKVSVDDEEEAVQMLCNDRTAKLAIRLPYGEGCW